MTDTSKEPKIGVAQRMTTKRCLIATVAVMLSVGFGVNAGASLNAKGVPALSASASTLSLHHAGWKVHSENGMPHTITGARQIAYLQTTTPGGVEIDLQFFSSHTLAIRESTAADRTLRNFHSDVVDNVVAFSHPNGHQRLNGAIVLALRARLR
jgi:hypothetical protein